MARALVAALLGDPDYQHPSGGVPLAKYFEGKTLAESHSEYEQLYLLPEWDRARDLVARMEGGP